MCRRVYVTLSMQTASNNNTNSHVWRNNFPKNLHCIESSHENWISFAHMISNIAWAFSSSGRIFCSMKMGKFRYFISRQMHAWICARSMQRIKMLRFIESNETLSDAMCTDIGGVMIVLRCMLYDNCEIHLTIYWMKCSVQTVEKRVSVVDFCFKALKHYGPWQNVSSSLLTTFLIYASVVALTLF